MTPLGASDVDLPPSDYTGLELVQRYLRRKRGEQVG